MCIIRLSVVPCAIVCLIYTNSRNVNWDTVHSICVSSTATRLLWIFQNSIHRMDSVLEIRFFSFLPKKRPDTSSKNIRRDEIFFSSCKKATNRRWSGAAKTSVCELTNWSKCEWEWEVENEKVYEWDRKKRKRPSAFCPEYNIYINIMSV